MYHGTHDIIFYTDSKIKQKLSKYRLLLLKKNSQGMPGQKHLLIVCVLNSCYTTEEIRLNLYAE